MSGEWTRLQKTFEEARQLHEEDRGAYLVERLGDDALALARVEAMLRADAIEELPIDRRMRTLAGELLDGVPPPPAQIGSYRIVGTLGRGGMGVVYRGVRPDLERADAIKVLYGTSLSPLRRELFDRERRVLASLRHPSIAQIYDAGSLPDGTPYFVMEEVTGLPLDEAVEQRRLSAKERLELFLRICDAVQFAHAHGVIHRDIKASNLLVPDGDGAPTVKLLDFGIAWRTIDDKDELHGAATAFTPAYAAPEQVAGDAATVQTDVYALGVLFYELLARRRPEPAGDRVKKSANRLASVSSSDRRVEEVRASSWRELDAICAKAVALEAADRYSTVDAFAEDLRRVLDHRPVQALPASFGYTTRKLARRHRLVVAFAATVALLLVGASALVFLQSGRVADQRDRAESERASAEQLSGFLLDLFRASDPAQTRGQEVLARDLLDAAAANLLRPAAAETADRERFLYAIARAYDHLGLYEEQADLLRAALESEGRGAGSPSPTLLRAELAGALLQLGRLDQAEVGLDEALVQADRTGASPLDRLAVESKFAHLRWLQGRLDEAEELFLRVIPALEAEGQGERTQRYHEVVANLAAVYSHQARFDEASELYERAIAELTDRVGSDHPRTLMQRGNLVTLELRRQRYERARELLLPLLADKRRVLGERHPDTLRSVNGLAIAEHYTGNLKEAEVLFREALAVSEESLPADHRETLALYGNLGAVLVDSGKIEEGLDLHRRVYEGFRRVLGEGHRFTALGLHNLAGANTLAGSYDEADRQFLEVQKIWTEVLPAKHPHLAMNLEAWAELHRLAGNSARSDELAEKARLIRETAP